jgi:hypothetical protein
VVWRQPLQHSLPTPTDKRTIEIIEVECSLRLFPEWIADGSEVSKAVSMIVVLRRDEAILRTSWIGHA